MITREFNLYLHAGHSIPLVINVNQYDRGESWVFTLFNSDGTQYTPSSGAIVGIKSDNLGIINTATVDSQGRVVVAETQQMTAAVGKAVFELVIDDGTHGTANFVVLVEPKPGDNADLSESDISMIEEAIEAASTIKPYGSPLVASTVAGMTDHEKVYVYVGSETGYTSGNWYYWNGSAWASGGVYNSVAVQTDTTLAISGMAADAKKTGDEISDLKSQINALGGGVPTSVRQAIYAILDGVGYEESDDYNDELATILSWAQTVTVLTLSASTLSLSGNTPQTLTASTTPAGGVVTWESSDPAVATVNNGVVTGASNGSCIITARCGDLTATCAVTVSGIVTYTITNTLTHVTSNNNAVSAGENTPYTATLTAEAGYTILTVTVTMGGDDITSTVYSNGVITISAVTGNVVITATASDTVIYHLENAVFTGDSSERIGTGIKPLSVDRDFTIAFELTRDGTYTNDSYVFQCMESSSPYWGAKFQIPTNSASYEAILFGATQKLTNYSSAYAGPLKVVIRHTANATSCEVKLRTTGAVGTYTVGSSIKTITNNLYIGGNDYKGTINSFTWYSYRFSDNETDAFLGVS